jgi:hypothetical protein
MFRINIMNEKMIVVTAMYKIIQILWKIDSWFQF